jgi:hypothetical protein
MTPNWDFKVVVTGHSLGGAMATIAAAYLRAAGLTCDLWTFGAPRVGNGAFADFVTAQPGLENRATDQDDPVPRLPPLFAGFRHTSPEYWFTKDIGAGAVILTEDVDTCAGNANLSCSGGRFGFNITAHVNYFGPISSCGGSTDSGSGVSEAEMANMVKEWSAKDIEFRSNGARA